MDVLFELDNFGFDGILELDLNPVIDEYVWDGQVLDSRSKTWLGKLVADNRDAAAHLAIRYGLNRKLITSFAKRIRRGHIIRNKGGRPTCLDNESINGLQNIIAQNDILLGGDFKEILLHEHKETVLRRVFNVNYDDIADMSDRSLKRYKRLFVENQDLLHDVEYFNN